MGSVVGHDRRSGELFHPASAVRCSPKPGTAHQSSSRGRGGIAPEGRPPSEGRCREEACPCPSAYFAPPQLVMVTDRLDEMPINAARLRAPVPQGAAALRPQQRLQIGLSSGHDVLPVCGLRHVRVGGQSLAWCARMAPRSSQMEQRPDRRRQCRRSVAALRWATNGGAELSQRIFEPKTTSRHVLLIDMSN